ncbi:CpXC domain-containing protein [Sorangium sp. So ce185]|uniref:CpXC domain-containing protein n=1 Tax=Sorangium sp. So ce185 TaxID=3133287 RepID=UPI003F601105
MSITAWRMLSCRACGAAVEGLTAESANPVRHPPFREGLLSRTLLRLPCPGCGTAHQHFDRFVWTDLPGRLCACVIHESERDDWADLEQEARDALSVPLREEGPEFVRAWGASVALRLVFGLEELREKVVCSMKDLDDRVVEAMKLELPCGVILDDVTPGQRLRFRLDARTRDVAWAIYEQTAGRRDALAGELPGIFDPRSAWVSCARARRPPRRP